MNEKDVSEFDALSVKIQRSVTVSGLQSTLPSGEKVPSFASFDELTEKYRLKSPDKLKSHKTGMQCSSATQLTEQLESSDLNITLL